MIRHTAAIALLAGLVTLTAAQPRTLVPTFAVDPMWPKPLPNLWILGAVAGIAVDRQDHVWVVHRPSTLQPNETRSIWRAAPPVLEFDAEAPCCSRGAAPATATNGRTSSTASMSTTRWCGSAAAARKTRSC